MPEREIEPLPTDYPVGSVVCRACDTVINGILALVPAKKPSGRPCVHRKTAIRFVRPASEGTD